MRLKRLYDHSGPTPKVSGILVLHAGPVQHFSPDFLAGAQAEGWLTHADGQVIIHGQAGAVVYRVVREPGRYPEGVIHYFDCVKVE